MRLDRGPRLCVFVAQIRAILFASGRKASHSWDQRLCLSRISSRHSDRARSAGTKKEGYRLIVTSQMVPQIGKRLLRVVSRLRPVHAVSLFILPAVLETKWPHGCRSHYEYRFSGDVVGT